MFEKADLSAASMPLKLPMSARWRVTGILLTVACALGGGLGIGGVSLTWRCRAVCRPVNGAGERHWVHVSLAALLGEEQWVRRFLLVLRDMSESEGAPKAAREHELSLERIFDSGMDAIITVGEAQRIVMFNPAAE